MAGESHDSPPWPAGQVPAGPAHTIPSLPPAAPPPKATLTTVVQADAVALRLPRRPFPVVASPPYAITSPLLRLLLAPPLQLIAADLVLQRAVVRRYAGG